MRRQCDFVTNRNCLQREADTNLRATVSVRCGIFLADLSLNDFPLPNISEFISVITPPVLDDVPQMPPARDPGDELPRNQWYYQYESNTHRRRHQQRPTDGNTIDRHQLKFTASDVTVTWVSFVATLVIIDVIWFVHRMARTYSTAKMILYGCTAPCEGIDTS